MLNKYKITILYSITSFLGAALLFIVEPLIAKLLLPEFGGAGNVWITSTFFFQVLMLLGYLFVNWSVKFGPRREPILQLILIVVSLISIPIILPSMESIPTQEPFSRLLLTLLIVIALPFLVLSTTGPLMQKWYSWTKAPRSNDPYFLYVSSNAGSLIGLLSYPFLIEPFFTLKEQRLYWSASFCIFIILIFLSGLIVYKQNIYFPKLRKIKNRIPLKTQVNWIFLSFIPASLQLGITTYFSSSIANFPLLWILPLSVYLITMIIAFSKSSRKVKGTTLSAVFSFIALISLGMGYSNATIKVASFILILISFSVISFVFHSVLASTRPEPELLTKYFVLISLGGALAGLFNSIISPFIFKSITEVPLVLTLSVLIMIINKDKFTKYLILGIVVFLSITILFLNEHTAETTKGRNFYGAWVILDTDGERHLYHGDTLQGKQSLNDKKKIMSYFNLPDKSFYSILENTKEITVIGLGTGIVAAFDKPEVINFIEIDPHIIEIASNNFTYLQDSSSQINILKGDGRFMIDKIEEPQDVIILDAFNSSSIPSHLLTIEAFEEYSSKLSPNGLILININNNFFNFAPVLKNNAEVLGYTSLIKRTPAQSEIEESNWVLMTKDKTQVNHFRDLGWRDIESSPISWSDEHSNLLEVINLSRG